MADNIPRLPGSRLNDYTYAFREIHGVHYVKAIVGYESAKGFVSSAAPTHNSDSVALLKEISNKLSTLIKYNAMLHGVELEEEL